MQGCARLLHLGCETQTERGGLMILVDAKYEKFLKDHNMTNGEIDINFEIIQEAY